MVYLRVVAVLLLLAASFSVQADAEFDYLLHCRGCHLPEGQSVPPEVPTLRRVLGELASTPEGRDYILRVPGVTQNSMSDEQLAAVLNWVMTEFNADTLPKNFKPYDEGEVAEARKNVLTDPLAYRARIAGVNDPRRAE